MCNFCSVEQLSSSRVRALGAQQPGINPLAHGLAEARGRAWLGLASLSVIATIALPACQAALDVDDYTFQATPVASAGAAGASSPGGAGAAGRGGAGGSNAAAGASSGMPPAQAGTAGMPADTEPGPVTDPEPPPDATTPEESPLAPEVAALEMLARPSPGFLRPAEVLVVGSPLRSRNDYVELLLEPDSISVTHQQVDGTRAVVASLALTNAHLATLSSGHLIVFARDGSTTDITSEAGVVTDGTLRVQNDGNVVLYDNAAVLPRAARWSPGTNFRRFADACRRLEPNQAIYSDETAGLPSCNGQFRLVMDAEGRLTVVDDSLGLVIFQSETGGGPASTTIMQRDGNLVIYDVDDVAVFASGTNTVPGAYAALEDDGTLGVFDPNDVKIWP